MESVSFLQDLAVVLLAAGFAAMLCHRFRQPKVLGYILAGLALGPHTPPFTFIRDEATIRTLADLGVIFLMFSVGLEFNLRRLRRVGATASVTAGLDVLVMVSLGYMLGRALGWSAVESLFLGGIVCDSSTTIVAKTLQELGKTRDKFAGVVIGITVVEDALAVAMITILTGVAVTGTLQAGLVAVRLWKLLLFLIVVVVVGLLTVPRLLDALHRYENDELLVVTLLGTCFGITLLAARLELSMALGAVLAGAIASESRAIQRIGPLIDPLRYTFSAVFFVAVGLLLNPATLLQHWELVLAVTGLVVVGKFGTNTIGSLLTGHDMPTSVRVGAGMAQIGEFAFIIAALGLTLGATTPVVYQVGVGASVLTILLSPYLIRGADRLALVLDQNPTCRRWTNYFLLYGQWVERIRRREQDSAVRRVVRRSIWIIAVNSILISATMIVAGYLGRRPPDLFPALATWPGLFGAALWVLAMLVCLPLYVATLRKLQAMGMVLAEVALPMTVTAHWARAMRSFVSNAILAAGAVGLVLLTFALSSAMFPSKEVFFLLMVGTALTAAWQWPKLVKVYAQAQGAVSAMLTVESGKTDAPASPQGNEFALRVESFVIVGNALVVGQELGVIRMQARTGATVVGIERSGRQIANPAPDERLQGGDRLFLLGSPDEINAMLGLLSSQQGGGPLKS